MYVWLFTRTYNNTNSKITTTSITIESALLYFRSVSQLLLVWSSSLVWLECEVCPQRSRSTWKQRCGVLQRSLLQVWKWPALGAHVTMLPVLYFHEAESFSLLSACKRVQVPVCTMTSRTSKKKLSFPLSLECWYHRQIKAANGRAWYLPFCKPPCTNMMRGFVQLRRSSVWTQKRLERSDHVWKLPHGEIRLLLTRFCHPGHPTMPSGKV